MRRKISRTPLPKSNRILVIQLAALGDVCTLVPAVRALAAGGEHQVDVVCRAGLEAVGITPIRVGLTGTLFGSLTSALSMRRYLAKKILALPRHFDWDWRVSADIVIQMGAIVVGGYMYYIAEPLMQRVVHETNAVANRVVKDPIDEYKYQANRRRMRLFFVDEFKVLINDTVLLRKEFERLPNKNFQICWKYIEASKKMNASIWKKVMVSIRMMMALLKNK